MTKEFEEPCQRFTVKSLIAYRTEVSGSMRIQLLIVDDHPLFRQGVRFYLETVLEFQIIGDLGDGPSTLDFLKSNQVDIVLLDIQMPGMDGVEVTRKIKESYPEIKILILTSFNSWDKVKAALKAGANAYVLKDAVPEELTAAIRAVAAGGSYLGADIAEKVIERVAEKPSLPEPLTDRELEVLRLIAKGLGNRAIAERLFLSEKTVKTHVTNILQKLQVKSRTQAAYYGTQQNLI